MSYQFYLPTRVLFGKGCLNSLHEQKLPGKKALIVTSGGQSVKKYGYLARLEKELELGGAQHVLFDKILPNPIVDHVMEGAELARREGCDFVVGLGGGSSIDSAKAIAVMARNEGHYWDYISGGSGKGKPVPCDPLPVIAVTTTAGTGTEADPWTVITNGKEKIGFGYDGTFPVLSIVDPDLMATVPPRLTAYQGFDALFHSTEGYINTTANEISDLFALKAISLIGKSLARAVKDGSDEEARADVALANTLSGVVETLSGCTAEHSMEHALSAYHPNLEHGAGLISISLEYYRYAAACGTCSNRLVDMARALGKQDASSPEDFVEALAELQKACGVDDIQLSEYGVKEEELSDIAANAMETMGGLFQVDPCSYTHSDVLSVLQKSYR